MSGQHWAPLCKPGQPAAPGEDRGPGPGASGGVPTGEISITVPSHELNFLGSPVGPRAATSVGEAQESESLITSEMIWMTQDLTPAGSHLDPFVTDTTVPRSLEFVLLYPL